MLEKRNPVKTVAWKALTSHYGMMKNRQMKDLFVELKDVMKNRPIEG